MDRYVNKQTDRYQTYEFIVHLSRRTINNLNNRASSSFPPINTHPITDHRPSLRTRVILNDYYFKHAGFKYNYDEK